MSKTRSTVAAMLIALVLLQGCAVASYRFAHQTKTQTDYEKDKYECGLVVQAITDRSPYRGNPLVVGPQAAGEFANCMKYRYGWEKVSCNRGEPGCGLYFQ